MTPVMASSIDIICLLDMTREKISEVKRSARLYCYNTHHDAGQSADVLAVVVDDVDDIFAQEVIWVGVALSFFTADDGAFIATALLRLSKTARTSGSDFNSPAKCVLDEVEPSRAALAKAKKEIEQQKWLASLSERTKN